MTEEKSRKIKCVDIVFLLVYNFCILTETGMNKNIKNKTSDLKEIIKDMPYFTIEGISSFDIKDYYLKIMLSRLKEKGEVFSLKRGIYVSKEFIEGVKRKNTWNEYMEFLCSILYNPSYLSLEYVLNENNVLSDSSYGFSAVSTKKTNHIKNKFGSFYYYNLKKDLFYGFKIEKRGDFFIYKATLGKALFDFLYIRKNVISSKNFLESMRINTEQIKEDDFREFKKYIDIEGSKKMKKIASDLCKLN
jgi:predicted transcriptional regulator of viral defense system